MGEWKDERVVNAAANSKAPLFNMTLSILQVTILVRAWSTNGAGVKIECCDKFLRGYGLYRLLS